MGCSSGRQPPAPVLYPDLDCGDSTEANNSLALDCENQNYCLNGEAGDTGRNSSKHPESLPTLERLAQATGGTEKSWYRCVFPFGVISLVIGMAGTGVTFTFNTLLQTKVVSVALLCTGFVMLIVAAVCWRVHRLKRRKKKESGFFSTEQGTLWWWWSYWKKPRHGHASTLFLYARWQKWQRDGIKNTYKSEVVSRVFIVVGRGCVRWRISDSAIDDSQWFLHEAQNMTHLTISLG